MKKLLILSAAAVFATAGFATTATIHAGSVSAVQTASRRVQVDYMIDNGPAVVTFDVLTNGVSIGGENLTNFIGAVNRKVESGANTFHWLPVKCWPGHVFPANCGVTVSIKVIAWDVSNPPDVMVIDLTSKSNVNYYASLDHLPGGIASRVYKTDKLVMRKIPAELVTWRMGSPDTESGYNKWVDIAHDVTLSHNYFMGVYEVTQKQWYLIQGTKPSYFTNTNCWETRPVEKVAYSNGDNSNAADIRGNASSWPTGEDPHTVLSSSFLGRLCTHSGIDGIDLPTEAQWEYACRAGSAQAYYNGLTYGADNIATLARYRTNGYVGGSTVPDQGCTTDYGTAEVGTYAPNTWGLYDMLGNVAEWCLDVWQGNLGTAAVTDPTGPDSGNTKTFRSGSWREPMATVRCGSRSTYSDPLGYSTDAGYNSWGVYNFIGFRVCLTLD